jgi:hypothetical protein
VSNTELKPCPCCGGEAKIGRGHGLFWGECTKCELTTRGFEWASSAEAVWNLRTDLALEAHCAALENLLRFARSSHAFSVSLSRDESIDELHARLQCILHWTDEVDAALTDNGGQG